MSTDIDKQLEVYRHQKYRRGRIRFYGLIVIAIALFSTLVGVIIISNQPIDVNYIKGADTAFEAAHSEYGDTYVNTLKNLPTVGYESQYQALKGTYIDLIEQDGSESDKNKIALDLAVFVEFVETEAVSTSRKYGLSEVSQEFYTQHSTYIEEQGNVYDSLIELIDSHSTHEGRVPDERLLSIINDWDTRVEMYTGYLTTLKNI